MARYTTKKRVYFTPRIPLEGGLDLSYRCNNNCRHCWLKISPDAPERDHELSLDEIRRIVHEARALGTREWLISGGEPMVRPDFPEILDYIATRSISYSLNTNGTLITPRIASLLTHKGWTMVALYGATAQVNDNVTRNPGSFEATLRGMAYLREAGVQFSVQLIPVKANYHQWQAMIDLGRRLSPFVRCGAPWLNLAGPDLAARNEEIAEQRLPPTEVIKLDEPNPWAEERDHRLMDRDGVSCRTGARRDARLFSGCIENGSSFHVDPYGGMSFCSLVKDPAMRFDLRRGSVIDAWELFFPSLADRIRGDGEWLRNCGGCENRAHCHWCPVYAYLETGRYSAPIPYLCEVAEESRRFGRAWVSQRRRYFRIAEITIQVESRLHLDQIAFSPALQSFEVDGPGEDQVALMHVFGLPDLRRENLGKLLYRKPPWEIYQKGEEYIYLGVTPEEIDSDLRRVAIFDREYCRGLIYNHPDMQAEVLTNGFHSLTLFNSDQILIAQLLAPRHGCYLHASGVVLNGNGLLFVGHSGAGKSTITRMLCGEAEILCDDRIIVRRWPNGFKIHGTWSHGEVPDISPNSAPLSAILFLEKSSENRLVRVRESREALGHVLACLIKAFVTREWWLQTLDLASMLVREVPCYHMQFDESGRILTSLRELVDDGIH